jgi:hypothetical protein
VLALAIRNLIWPLLARSFSQLQVVISRERAPAGGLFRLSMAYFEKGGLI